MLLSASLGPGPAFQKSVHVLHHLTGTPSAFDLLIRFVSRFEECAVLSKALSCAS